MTVCNCGALGEYKDPFNPYSLDYCSSCFSAYLEKKILRGVPRRVRGQHIAVAVSGGKDSLVLLNVLYSYQNELKLPSLIALVLEEEIPDIQQERQKIIQYLHKHYPDLSINIIKYSELFGHTLPHLVTINDSKKLGFTPCSICGIFRKQALFQMGLQAGVDFIALGTTLEDEASTIILNIIRGFPTLSPTQNSYSNNSNIQRLPQRIKPLARISEDLIRIYIRIKNIPIISQTCPYAQRSLRSEITAFISTLKDRDPQGSFLFNILKTKNDSERKTSFPQNTYHCTRCQMISHHSLCPSCRILSNLLKSS